MLKKMISQYFGGIFSIKISQTIRLVLAYLKDITGALLDPLQFDYRPNRFLDDAVNMGLHFILQHLDRPGTYVRILFVDFRSTFNTIIPDTLQNKLTQLSIPTSTNTNNKYKLSSDELYLSHTQLYRV